MVQTTAQIFLFWVNYFISLSLSFFTSEMKICKIFSILSLGYHGLKAEKRVRKPPVWKFSRTDQRVCYILRKFLEHPWEGGGGGSISSEQELIYDLVQGPWETQGSKLLFPWNYSIPVNPDEMRQKQDLIGTLEKQNCWFLWASVLPLINLLTLLHQTLPQGSQ